MSFQVKARDIRLHYSGKCNMDCKYCYVPTSKLGDIINCKVIESFDNQSQVKSITDNFIGPIDTVELWGAEPTINVDMFEVVLSDLFHHIPTITSIKFSTNAYHNQEDILRMLDIIASSCYYLVAKHACLVDIQLSLDGPEWVTDYNRRIGATEAVVNTFKGIISSLNHKYPTPLRRVLLHFKPTLTVANFLDMVNDNNRILDWMLFFESLCGYFLEYNRDDRVKCQIPPWPTIETPGNYTAKDGVVFREWLSAAARLDMSGLRFYTKPLFRQPYRFMESLLHNGGNLLQKSREYKCGAAGPGYAVGIDGNIYMCHQMYIVDPDSGIDIPLHYQLAKNHIANIYKNGSYDLVRLQYIMEGFSNYYPARFYNAVALIKSLANAGQVEEIYLYDDKMLFWLAFTSLALDCIAGTMLKTGSFHVLDSSILKLLGNGALQIILQEFGGNI